MSIDIVAENALAGENYTLLDILGAGDMTNIGFCREFSVNVGETATFSLHGTGNELDIYRLGYYAGDGWRKVATIPNTPTTQPDPIPVADSNGATTCTNWSVTASWAVPTTAVSGLYIGVYRNLAKSNASYVPFIVRDDDAEADIIYKTSDATWALAYNYFNTPSSPLNGKSWYGSGGPMGNIGDRSFYATYHKPIVTRDGISQTYWRACEYPLIRFLERNGYKVKYISSKDLDRDPSILSKGKIFLSSGHDEYWSMPMRRNVENWRDDQAGRSIFMSGNEVFWKIRYDATRDGAWCYKDTMPGPGAHVAGQPLDPVEWTGTWKDQRWAQNEPEWLLTGTDFRMNGVNDFDALIVSNPYGGHKVWGGSALVDSTINIEKVLGFEADDYRPTQPTESVRLLAAYTRAIGGNRADDNGQFYNNQGDIKWGIVSQRYTGGGLTIGFGTCQWSWALDNVHDRLGATPVNRDAQQFTVNLLNDLGAAPQTLMAGINLQPVNSLDAYGLEPGAEPEPTSSGIMRGDGTMLSAHTLTPSGLIPLVNVPRA